MSRSELSGRLEEFRATHDNLNEQMVSNANAAARFMREHSYVKAGDTVYWMRENQPEVAVRVSYVEGSYRWIMAWLERPPVRGFVLNAAGEPEGVERHIYSQYRRADEKSAGVTPGKPTVTRVRQRTPVQPAAEPARVRVRVRPS